MQTAKNGIARRCRIDLMSTAELAILNAQLALEGVGCHVILTDAATMLSLARDKVADFVELDDPHKQLGE